MKVTHHIPQEQFGFTELEYETGNEKEIVLDAIASYHALKSPEMPSGEGLDPKEWNSTLDGYIASNTMTSEVYERMSREQQHVIQEIKKSVKRKNYGN